MIDIFQMILHMSASASFVVFGVMIIRLVLKKAPKIFSYVLWLSVWIRLAVPFHWNSRFSFFRIWNMRGQTNIGGIVHTPYAAVPIESGIVPAGMIEEVQQVISPLFESAGEVNRGDSILHIASMIWIVGMIVLLVYSLISYMQVIHNVKTATLVKDNIYETDQILSPFVDGFVKPKIYIPTGISENSLAHILAHEQTHIKRKDHLIKPLAYVVFIMHWFNPLIWVSFVMMSKDMEMSCDESVLGKMGKEERGAYANILLSVAMKKSGLLQGSPLGFGEEGISARIKNILRYKKTSFWVTAVSLILILICMVGFLTNPKTEKHVDKNEVLFEDIPREEASQASAKISGEAAAKIEEHIKMIMSSPTTSSHMYDYIQAHQNEYENILKMGEEALSYLLSQFASNQVANDLRGQIIMSLCKELLGDRNNVVDESLPPLGWFSALSPYEEVKLPDFQTNSADWMERLVYDAAVQRYSYANDGFTVVAPTIFGSYEEGDKLRIIVTVYSSRYKLYDNTVSEVGGSIIPAAITYTKNQDGSYTLEEYLEAMDGSYWLSSIEEFCVMPISKKEIRGLRDQILEDNRSNSSRSALMRNNLIEHLQKNHLKGIDLKERTGEVVPLT